MATVTLTVPTNSTTDGSSWVSDAFTPASNDLLVVAIHQSGSNADEVGSVTSSQGITFYRAKAVFYVNTAVHIFVAESLASAVSQTVTYTRGSGTANAAVIEVFRISGMTATGASAVVQTAQVEGATGVNGSVTFASNCNTNNVVIIAISSAQTVTAWDQSPPTGFSEGSSVNTTTPADGYQSFYANSGITTAAHTCGGSTAENNWCSAGIELQPSAASVLVRSFGVIFG